MPGNSGIVGVLDRPAGHVAAGRFYIAQNILFVIYFQPNRESYEAVYSLSLPGALFRIIFFLLQRSMY
jgi:hypothetical protein